MITYKLTASGYSVLLDGVEWVQCPYDPAQGGTAAFTSDEAKLAHIAANYPGAVAA